MALVSSQVNEVQRGIAGGLRRECERVDLGQAEAADGGGLPGSVVVEADEVVGGERRPGGESAPMREVERGMPIRWARRRR